MPSYTFAAARRFALAAPLLVSFATRTSGQTEAARSAVAHGVASDAPAFTVRVVGRGRPMLLIPGMASDGAVWSGLVERYRDRYEMHVFTLAGFAGVPASSVADYATRERDAVVEYIRSHHLDRPIVVGHSFGGFLAYSVASTAPSSVGPVVSIDGLPFLPGVIDTTATPDKMRGQADAIRAGFARLTPAQIAEQLRPSFAQMMHDTASLTRAMEWAKNSDPATVGATMAAMLTTDLRPALASITMPVLQIAALGAYPAAMHSTLAARYEAQVAAAPRHQVVIAEQAYHFVMLDDLDFVVREIDRFLNAPSRR